MKESSLTDIIYDTLMNNGELSEYHETLDLNIVDDQECDSINAKIKLIIYGDEFTISITKTHVAIAAASESE